MNSDKLTIEILADGTIKTSTDSVSGANHDNAENFLRNVATLTGGQTTRKMRSDIPADKLRRILQEHSKDGHTHDSTTEKHSH